MLVALIDDGIASDLYPELCVRQDLLVMKDGSICPADQSKVLTDHGTTCARIIQKYAGDENLEFCVLRVFNAVELKTTAVRLAAALDWCCEQDIPIVHLSVGSTLLLDGPLLRRSVGKLLRKRIALVAAHSNHGGYTQPACFTGVFGVCTDPKLNADDYYVLPQADENQIQIYASSQHILSQYSGKDNVTQLANSYAAPVITAHLCRIMSSQNERVPLQVLYDQLAGQPVDLVRLRPDFLNEAILYDAGETQYLRQALFASVFCEVHSREEFLQATRENPDIPVLILPSENAAHALQLTSCSGILFAGPQPAVPPDISVLCWNETGYTHTLRNLPSVQPARHPDITVYADEDAAILLCLALKERFEEDRYTCCILSDFPRAYLYGMDYLPETALYDKLAANVLRLYDPDVLICCMQHFRPPKAETEVRFTGEQSMVMDADRVQFPLQADPQEIEQLYQFVLMKDETISIE